MVEMEGVTRLPFRVTPLPVSMIRRAKAIQELRSFSCIAILQFDSLYSYIYIQAIKKWTLFRSIFYCWWRCFRTNHQQTLIFQRFYQSPFRIKLCLIRHPNSIFCAGMLRLFKPWIENTPKCTHNVTRTQLTAMSSDNAIHLP